MTKGRTKGEVVLNQQDRKAFRSHFTQRGREIAQLFVTRKSSKQIAREPGISHRTVNAHRARLMRKYGVGTTGELIDRLIGRH